MLLEQMVNFEFDFSAILIYLSGIATGIILAFLIYILLVLISINKKRKIIEACENNITEEEVREMIKRSKENYILLSKSKDKDVRAGAFKETCLTLVNDIAKKCFPKSKNPMLELSIDESLLLSKYIIQRIEELLNVKGVRIVRKITVSRLFSLWNVKKKVDNNLVVKEVKKYSKVAKVGITIANAITKPFKLIGSGAKNLIVNKIILTIFNIVGEETYKIYTKQAIKSMDPEYIKLMEEIDKEIIENEVVEVE